MSTHWHWDHVFGNPVFASATWWAHPQTIRMLAGPLDDLVADARRWLPDEAEAFSDVRLEGRGNPVPDRIELDLGRRTIEVFHPGPAHTLGDLAVYVPDADLVVAGDLLEEGAPPQFDDADPCGWPEAVERVLFTGARRFIPGHGGLMVIDQVHQQLDDLRTVAASVSTPHQVGTLPYPKQTMETARRRFSELGG